MNSNVWITAATFLAVAAGALFVILGAYRILELLKPSAKKWTKSESELKEQGLQPASEKEPSPLCPQHFVDLFIRPSKFFSGQIVLGEMAYVIFVAWCYGVASVFSWIDRDLARESRGMEPIWKVIRLRVADSWLDFWVWAISLGAIAGLFLWLVGGWWYHTRLRWSGANNPANRTSRLLYVYTSFVKSAPTIAIVLLWTALMPNYRQASMTSRNYLPILLIFSLWSLVTSYIGATTLFTLDRWKARMWFLLLPAAFYVLTFVLAALLSFMFGYRE